MSASAKRLDVRLDRTTLGQRHRRQGALVLFALEIVQDLRVALYILANEDVALDVFFVFIENKARETYLGSPAAFNEATLGAARFPSAADFLDEMLVGTAWIQCPINEETFHILAPECSIKGDESGEKCIQGSLWLS